MTTPRGFALPTLMVMLALASISTLLAMRNLWVNEQLLNAEADQRRTLHKAHAGLAVAVAEIVGTTGHTDSTLSLRHSAGEVSQTHAFFPKSMTEYKVLRQRLTPNTCSAGICAPSALTLQTGKASHWKTQIAVAQAITGKQSPYGNGTAWYWIEVFPEANSSHENFIYRITVLAHGVLPSSTAALQAIWTRPTSTSSTGQWRSWHVLHD